MNVIRPLSTTDMLVLPTADDVAQEALKQIISISEQAISEHGSFSIVMAGGTTPEKVYRLLAEEDCDWDKWQLYMGDERCLARDDSERNSVSVRKNLIDKINIPETNIHFIPGEFGAETAAKTYAKVIASQQSFDLVMLGMGEDGHTASLFPGHIHDKEELVHPIHDSPKPPDDRVSMSARVLSQNHYLMILVTGKNKKYAVRQWQAGDKLPVAAITTLGNKTVLLDEAAAVNIEH